MVVTKLIGGLGNQMFQYAAGRRLAHVLGVELKLDITGFEHYPPRKYYLENFNIKENFASLKEIRALTKRPIVERVLSRTLRRPPRTASTYIREKLSFHFDPDILSLPNGVYLDGYWQSEKYFADIAGIIRREFTVKTPQKERDKELAELTASCDSVSLHIRRGDYVSNARTNQILGTCDRDYYFRCVEYLAQPVKNPHLFVFSDDSEGARENLKLSYPMTLVDHNGADKNYEDLRLMSQCKHHIIANSTFSWWGAWLAQRRDKIVFAPKSWHTCEKFDTSDLIPDKWTRI